MAETNAADFLALPDLFTGSRRRTDIQCLQDVPEDIQQGSANSLWRLGARAEREDQRECAASHRLVEHGLCQYRRPLSPCPCGPTRHCPSAKTQAGRRDNLGQRPNAEAGKESHCCWGSGPRQEDETITGPARCEGWEGLAQEILTHTWWRN